MAETWVDQGGYLSNTALDKKFFTVSQPMHRFRQFCDVKSALGKHAGQSENWLQVANVGTIGGQLTETNTMFETTQSKSWGTLTMQEYGNSLPFTFKVTTLSKFDLEAIIKKGLMDDKVKVIDGVIEREFNSCVLRYVGTATGGYALTTNGTATATNTSALNTYHLRKMILELKKRNVPGYSTLDGGYVLVASHEAVEGLQSALESIYQYTAPGLTKLTAGEIGRYQGCRIVEDGWATRYTVSATARTATAKSWTGSYSLDAYMFGAETVKEAVAVAEEVRMKEVTDFGRSYGLAWYALLGFRIMWGSAAADEANCRIIKWDSA